MDEWHDLGERFGQALKLMPARPREDSPDGGEYTLGELLDSHPELRPPVIHGLLRQGETMNVIATSKTGKSWLVIDLALAVATGGTWLGLFPVEQGQVLLIDNELHRETLADRIRKVAQARGIDPDQVRDLITVKTLRGQLRDIVAMRSYFERLQPGRFKLAILDTLYRMLPADVSENDNTAMAGVYNTIDSYADRLKASMVSIHHASKGSQADKAVTDVGAGAGSQSRATDTHMVLRPHEDEGVFVLDVALRSWAPMERKCLRWEFPIWQPAEGCNPELLSRPEQKRRQAEKEAKAKENDGALLAALDRLDQNGKGVTRRELQSALGWGYDKTCTTIHRLVDASILELCQTTYKSGKGREGECLGVRRRAPG